MRVLIAHNYYLQSGGEDDVVAYEMELLQGHGHEVRLLARRNSDIQSAWDKVKVSIESAYSGDGKRQMARAIRDFSPDVVHVHNFFPLLSPSIYDACLEAGVPVVQTLHNYRLVCAPGQLLRNGRPCEKCLHGAHFWSIVHRCYRNSLIGSFFAARMLKTHWRRGTWFNKVGCYIAPSRFMKKKFVEGGLPEDKIHVKPNFVPEHDSLPPLDIGAPRQNALFAARLSEEKGVDVLLAALKGTDVPLRILGDGPMMDFVKQNAAPSMSVMGWLPLESLIDELRQAEFLVMPSTWYEGLPVTLVLAYCNGLPIIASRLGAMEEVIDDGVTGLLFNPGDPDDLRRKVTWAIDNPERMREMGRNARAAYERQYSPSANYRMLMRIYKTAMAQCQSAVAARNLSIANLLLDVGFVG